MPRYQIERPVKLVSGVVELDESLAAPLVESGSLVELEDSVPSPSDSSDNTTEQSEVESGDAVALYPEVMAAIENLDPDDEKLWTKSKAPKTDVLSDALGREVSAEDRDHYWEVYQSLESTEGVE